MAHNSLEPPMEYNQYQMPLKNQSSLSSGVKSALHLVHFRTNFDLQLQEATKIFSYFWLQLVRIKTSKNRACDFWLCFYFLRYWPIIHFCSFEISTKNWGITGKVLLSSYFLKCTPLLKKLHQRFFELELKHGMLTEDLYFFIGTVPLLHPQD